MWKDAGCFEEGQGWPERFTLGELIDYHSLNLKLGFTILELKFFVACCKSVCDSKPSSF